MNAKDDSKTGVYIAAVESGAGKGVLVADINLSDDRRLTLWKDADTSQYFCSLIEDSEGGEQFAAELTVYPPESSSSSSSSGA